MALGACAGEDVADRAVDDVRAFGLGATDHRHARASEIPGALVALAGGTIAVDP